MKCILRGFIRQRELNGMPFSEAEIRSMALQVFQGLDFMHRQRGYMHRDLKPENLLVNERKEVKISDLGSAIEIDSRGNMFDHHVTTLCYEAPEMLLETSYDEKVDMWAAGLILVDMFQMFPLYRGNDQLYMMRQVLGAPDCNSKIGRMVAEALVNKPEREEEKGGVGFRAILPDASESAIDLIQSLCSWEPSKRPSAAEALRHPFFKSANNVAAAPAFSCCAVPKTTSLSYMQPIC
ncbi:PREDICTED: cyclin-dependent kinase F-4-like [Fragaria vesca subsp. vesca]|uniref:cyclin-dependent kinase F-4-like n=1 Tax=Fragaria vesca subsp. vesca TaxID=101020 RepID=UPI0002C2FDAB|nr:PREDICTED: cyclin-dependent kinase F-4-like [Fragaria vesca subsp. vesca]